MRLSTPCYHVKTRRWGAHKRGQPYPERLLGEIVRVAAPRPQSARTEAARGVIRGPREACAGPLRTHVVRDCRLAVLPCVIGELLVVRDELPREKRERGECKDAVGGR